MYRWVICLVQLGQDSLTPYSDFLASNGAGKLSTLLNGKAQQKIQIRICCLSTLSLSDLRIEQPRWQDELLFVAVKSHNSSIYLNRPI